MTDLNLFIFIAEAILIIGSILCIKLKKYKISIILMIILLFIHMTSNWNTIFYFVLYIRAI